ncbi:MAG: xanthine dehydrogenase family protein subunit M, partial [Alphaproteobacteria bacterium]
MYDFGYKRPASLAEAAAFLRENEDAKLLAGGQTLIPTLKQRLAMPTDLLDIRGLEDLKGIREEGGRLIIGAAETHADVAASRTVQRAIPALAYLAGQIGDPLVRHMGTLGGSVANNDPSADYPAAVLGLGATVVTNTRSIPADDFFLGMFETALAADEIITRIEFPVPDAAGYAKFPNPASRYATVGVFVSKAGGNVRVAVTGAGPGVFRVEAMEDALAKDFTPESIVDIKVSPEGLSSDMHASAEYRAHLVTVMARRAVSSAV